jgi:hypothetical protein
MSNHMVTLIFTLFVIQALKFKVILYTHVISIRVYTFVYVHAGVLNYVTATRRAYWYLAHTYCEIIY